MREIDRRRFLAGAGAGTVAGLAGCLGVFGGDDAPGGLESLPNNGAQQYVGRVESFENNGREHVDRDVDYPRTPPLSGPHADDWVNAGFYTERQRPEQLVHTLEHGGVVAYYDPDAITESARSDLRERANTYTDTFAPFVAAPALRDDPPVPYTLTAWRHRLPLEEYDPEAVTAFLAQYVGRGPENPVR